MNKYLEDEKGFTDTCVYTRVSDISDRVFNFQIIIKYFITCNTYLVYTGYTWLAGWLHLQNLQMTLFCISTEKSKSGSFKLDSPLYPKKDPKCRFYLLPLRVIIRHQQICWDLTGMKATATLLSSITLLIQT